MAGEMAKRMGERIKERRLALGLNQRHLADRMSEAVSNQHISNWERAVNQPSERYLQELAEALEVDVGYFMTTSSPAKTPDLLGAAHDGLAGEVVALREKINSIEHERQEHAERIEGLLARQSEILERIEELVEALTDGAARQALIELGAFAARAVPEGEAGSGSTPARGGRRRRAAG